MKSVINLFLEKCLSVKQNIVIKTNIFLQKCATIQKSRALRSVAVTVAMIGFLGFLYPELCITEDTCRVVYVTEDGKEEEIPVEEGSELYYQLLSAEPEEIKMKSRLLEWLRSIW